MVPRSAATPALAILMRCNARNEHSSVKVVWAVGLSIVVAIGGTSVAFAQELEPRAYSASPVGATFLVVAASRSSGSVFTDPSIPLEDVHATLGAAAIGIGHTFNLFTRTALVTGAVPYGRGTATGRIEETTQKASRTGWVDARAKLSVNLLGGRALTPAEFAQAPRSTIVGVSFTVAMPTGQYYPDRLVNLGSNRWSYKPEAGISVPVGRWTFDGYVGLWLFGENNEFFPGTARRAQDPVTAVQGHVSYTLRPRFWLAFDATWYRGGTTTIDGIPKADLQRNSRLGVLVSVPLGHRQAVKASYSAGATTRFGGDFKTFGLAWQMTWIK